MYLQLLIPELSVYQVSLLGLVILPGIQQRFIVDINTLHFLPLDFFKACYPVLM